MKTKVAVTVDIDKDDPKYCGTKCEYRNFDSSLCFLRSEEHLTCLDNDNKGRTKRSAYCRRGEIP